MSPWSEEAEEDKDNGEEVAEEQFEEDVQGVHGVPGENSLRTKVFFSLSTIKPCGENADALAKGDDGGPDEELRDGGEDGDDDEGEQEVFALVQAGQH